MPDLSPCQDVEYLFRCLHSLKLLKAAIGGASILFHMCQTCVTLLDLYSCNQQDVAMSVGDRRPHD